ncbi:MAG: single-stranded DNA-binding protein [Verrucomicrobiales bacterium]|jgi:single-strand DNA-binding protein|nr:single-stranded DNA-binding protein [Verrucomicrobiales bacterium]
MASLNKVFLIGNLTRDPEIRHTPKGTAVGDLRLAVSMMYRTQDGSDKEEVCFVDIVVWGRQAETCKDYLTKGSPVFVEGRLQFDQWETQQGEKRSRLRVCADRVQFLGRGGSGGGSSGGGRSSGGYSRDGGGEPQRREGGGSRDYERPPRDNYDEQPAGNDAGAADDEIPF